MRDLAGASEIHVGWLLPDRTPGGKSLSMRKGTSNIIAPFQWSRPQVSAKNNLFQPFVTFLEHDPGLSVDCWYGLCDRFNSQKYSAAHPRQIRNSDNGQESRKRNLPGRV